MAKNKKKNKDNESFLNSLHHETKKSIWIVSFLGLTVILILAAIGQAGPLGERFFQFFEELFGVGYFLLPVVSFVLAFSFVAPEEDRNISLTVTGVVFFVLSGLGFIDIVSSGAENGGLIGSVIGALESPFGAPASLVITGTTILISFLIILNRPLRLSKVMESIKSAVPNPREKIKIKSPSGGSTETKPKERDEEEKTKDDEDEGEEEGVEEEQEEGVEEEVIEKEIEEVEDDESFTASSRGMTDYEAPPLSLLTTKTEKPTSGDLKANANIIKRTLDSFDIPVEMGEVEVGPTVTRYTLKPAEGVKLSKITSLNQDLALALAAHPVRIEAPIPGRSVVGIEVPNESAAMVRLGSLIDSDEFRDSSPLTFSLGRDVSGNPKYVDIAKMPHMLVAGATGSGKSITLHSLLISLLYKNSPQDMRLVLVDPKRVEMSVYKDLPHLVTPVITKNDKALSALKWAIDEMERRYEALLDAGARDIKSYNKKADEPMPYVLIVIDELADLMTSHGKEVEGAIVRLAQMSRATGIHLVVSTQRPSVEVITGLIKANITARIALQVASQVDSRTILDAGGAEKLLGSGDLLFESAESSKPVRIQGSYVTEKEVKKVAKYIKKHNQKSGEEVELKEKEDKSTKVDLDEYQSDQDKDELFEDAVKIVKNAGKGSASLLQRRLSIGYARAARILDQMHEEGLVGPARGSKAREVYMDDEEEEEESEEQESPEDDHEENKDSSEE